MTLLTKKESEVYARFAQEMKKLHENPIYNIVIYVEKLASKNPNKNALYYKDYSWTWNELNKESNKIVYFFNNLE